MPSTSCDEEMSDAGLSTFSLDSYSINLPIKFGQVNITNVFMCYDLRVKALRLLTVSLVLNEWHPWIIIQFYHGASIEEV